MLQAVRDFYEATASEHRSEEGARSGLRGVKLAGGIRTSKEAVRYLVMVNEVAGDRWLTPAKFRFGASTLLNDLLQQRHKLTTGAYDGPDYVSID
jgi:deoxyribose-phosphate aldolase